MTEGRHPGPWVCFHCNEVCETEQQAIDHFGYDESEMPGCLQLLTEGEKAIIEDRREWREKFHKEEHAHEHARHELSQIGWSVWQIIRPEVHKNRPELRHRIEESVQSLAQIWESIEGRALAAESVLMAMPRWLREHFRARAERLRIESKR